MDNKEIEYRQLVESYNNLKKSVDFANNQKNLLHANINDINMSIKSIELLSSSDSNSLDESFISLGSGCFIKSKIEAPLSQVLVNVGSGLIISKNISDSIIYLNEQKNKFESMIVELNESISKMNESIHEIESRINKITMKNDI